MTRRVRLAAAAGAIGAMLLFVTPFTGGAHAEEPVLAGLNLNGLARGVGVDFGFTSYVLPKILDIGIPHSNSTLTSDAGGEARAVAAQVFPGDVVTGAYGEKSPFPPPFPAPGFPGYREANYPGAKATEQYDANDDTSTVAALFNQNIPTNAGPLTFAASHLKTVASASASRALVTTQGIDLDPILHIASIETLTESDAAGAKIGQIAKTTIHDLRLTLSDSVAITIGTIRSEATSTSDGENADADARFVISDVSVVIAGRRVEAAIDNKGIRLTGFPDPIPGEVPQSLKSQLEQVLNQTGVSVTTSDANEIVDGAGGDASVGGLLVILKTAVPNVFIPDQAGLLLQQLYNNDTLGKTYCLKEQEPQQLFSQVPLPLCLTPLQLIPGFGQGAFATLSFGTVHAAASAAKPFEIPPPPGPGGGFTDGGPDVGNDSFLPPGDTGSVPPPGGNGGQSQPRALGPRFGLVAKMPPGVLLAGGSASLLLAVALAMGPSLRRWKPRTR